MYDNRFEILRKRYILYLIIANSYCSILLKNLNNCHYEYNTYHNKNYINKYSLNICYCEIYIYKYMLIHKLTLSW